MVAWSFAQFIAVGVYHELGLESGGNRGEHGTEFSGIDADPGPGYQLPRGFAQCVSDEFFRVRSAPANDVAKRWVEQFRRRAILDAGGGLHFPGR